MTCHILLGNFEQFLYKITVLIVSQCTIPLHSLRAAIWNPHCIICGWRMALLEQWVKMAGCTSVCALVIILSVWIEIFSPFMDEVYVSVRAKLNMSLALTSVLLLLYPCTTKGLKINSISWGWILRGKFQKHSQTSCEQPVLKILVMILVVYM